MFAGIWVPVAGALMETFPAVGLELAMLLASKLPAAGAAIAVVGVALGLGATSLSSVGARVVLDAKADTALPALVTGLDSKPGISGDDVEITLAADALVAATRELAALACRVTGMPTTPVSQQRNEAG